ncbi:MAG TPA: IPT/TIG domain-containing protein [Solirubrobacterales bacterium]|nr:IPT/TIG domain-containing protein [Solirubrobacterales bacterium]
MVWRRPGRRALVATLTVVAALLPISLVAAVSAFAGSPARPGGNGGSGPAIVGFSPQEGSIRGGTVVQISGGGFEGVTGVSFGGHPARSFEVESENVITAVAPSVSRGLNVRIVVAAAGGTATSNRNFTFIGCHVPRLKDDRVRRARKTLVAAGCRTGRVSRARGARKPLRVIAEHPHAGLWLEPGARVSLRVR